ncbi:MAG: DNA polymerase III subunit beta [Phycisphaeraceae bacterium]|nr:DNA polymerase III subunit beta [Phycisphaeraceae bacterium]
MKLICDRGSLVEALNLVGSAIASRTPKPVLTCVKLQAQADTGSLTLSATDLEVAIRMTTPRVEVSEAGEALVPADKFSQIVRESVDATLTLEKEQEALHIRGQDSHFKVFGFSAEDFPPIPAFEGEADFQIGAGELSRLIHQTIYATARENSRYAINGVLVEREGNKLAVVATDGHRLALARGECQAKQKDNRSAIVPTKALNMLLRLLDDPEEEIKVKIAGNQVMFATAAAMLASNLVEGNFPPYKDVIPRDGDKKATLNTEALASGVRRAALLTNEESKGVRMAFKPDGLTLSSRAPEMGEAEIRVDCPNYDGEPLEIGFNPHYVLDALKVVGAEQVQIDMRAANKPGVIRSGPNFLYVVMPVNLQ